MSVFLREPSQCRLILTVYQVSMLPLMLFCPVKNTCPSSFMKSMGSIIRPTQTQLLQPVIQKQVEHSTNRKNAAVAALAIASVFTEISNDYSSSSSSPPLTTINFYCIPTYTCILFVEFVFVLLAYVLSVLAFIISFSLSVFHTIL